MDFISPKYDFCMKALFSNETVRTYFISDVLGISVEDIRSVRLLTPLLAKRYHRQKQGILDILVEMNDDAKINIELQVKFGANWDRRSLFYLAKMYTDDLRSGEEYDRLKRCVQISILDFNLTEDACYHSVYRLRDEHGREFSDVFEVHIIELRKRLSGDRKVDEWIRFFNITSKEELDMIRTKNEGLIAAIRELRSMSLSRRVRMHYEAHQKEVRDRKMFEKTIRKESMQQGLQEGLEQGLEQGIRVLIATCAEFGCSREEILLRLQQEFSITEEEALAYCRRADETWH